MNLELCVSRFPSHLIPFQFISSRFISPHFFPSHLTSSHFISLHLTLSHLIPSPPLASHCLASRLVLSPLLCSLPYKISGHLPHWQSMTRVSGPSALTVPDCGRPRPAQSFLDFLPQRKPSNFQRPARRLHISVPPSLGGNPCPEIS